MDNPIFFLIFATELKTINIMKVSDIKWDCDDETVILPLEVEVPDDLDDIDEISEWLSDEYSWGAESFSLPIKDDGKD